MICCALLLLLLGAVRAVVLTLLPGRSRHERTPFPPAARRIVGVDGASPVLTHAAATSEPAPRRAAGEARHRALGTALALAGTAWFVVGLVGMHVFGIGATSMGASLWRDMAFHLSGPLLASAGLLLRAPAPARRPGPTVPLPAGPAS